MRNIKAVLFDSGKVLNGLATGNWFIAPNFFEFVDRKKYDSIPNGKKRDAFKIAGEYIKGQNLIVNEDEEYKHFVQYYKIFSIHLPELELSMKNINAIAGDLVYNYDKYKFYDDAVHIIPMLAERYKLAVVSDAWPSLENVFKKAGMRDYFSSFVISSIIGVSKPDKIMYETALEQLKVLPCEAVFIDDNIKNCDGAAALGIRPILLCRDKKLYLYYKLFHKKYDIINKLSLIKIFN